MPTIFKEFCSPNQTYVDGSMPVRLKWDHYESTEQLEAEIKWQHVNFIWSPVVTIEGSAKHFDVPSGTFVYSQNFTEYSATWVWEVRVRDSTGWSEWSTQAFDASRPHVQRLDDATDPFITIDGDPRVNAYYPEITVVSSVGTLTTINTELNVSDSSIYYFGADGSARAVQTKMQIGGQTRDVDRYSTS